MLPKKLTRALLITASTTACMAGLASQAHAQSTDVSTASDASIVKPELVINEPDIFIRDDLDLDTQAPDGAYDSAVDVTGVAQIVSRPDQNTFGLGLCSGTLINPRTVIFAAHCVNGQAAESYGFASGGTAISAGFSADNLPGVRRWVGLDGGTANATDLETNIYNIEQIWYDPRSLEQPAGDFLEADVALATLDTHADGVPTWTMLFSPLSEETHGIINGYGGRGYGDDGVNLGIDFRRRIAENMISTLSSLDDRNNFLFGPDDPFLPQNLYQTDFDSPAGEAAYDPAGGNYDFDLYDGEALPREGTTAGGDSGGPLIADEAFDKPVVVGVLSGGSRFFLDQPSNAYGSSSFYQPLFLFWDQIVANNSYVYARNLNGIRFWSNPKHWIQEMDPNYAIAVNGELENALPGFEAPGVSGETPQFGNVCFLNICEDLSLTGVALEEGDPNSVYIEGGPGTRNFVPNNVVADPSAGIKARYYEVTLGAYGATRLKSDITIDRLNVEGPAILDIRKQGSLKVWGDYTQTGGLVNVDGSLTTGEAFIGQGILTGSGTFDPTYLTSVGGIIAPGGFGQRGTLTVAGDVILSSASTTYFDVGRGGHDTLAVIGDADNTGIASLGGTAVVINKFGRGNARWGQTFEILTAEGGVENTFDNVVGRIGVLYPELEYDNNSVTAKMRAIRFSDFFRNNRISNPFALGFAGVLDGFRGRSYNDLSSVYGVIDIMEAPELSATFQNLSATSAGRMSVLDERQSANMRNLVSDRLSILGSDRKVENRIRIAGSADAFFTNASETNASTRQNSFAANYQSSTWGNKQLPKNMSGFISYKTGRSALAFTGDAQQTNQNSRQVVSGLEFGVSRLTSIGTAFGFAEGEQVLGGEVSDVKTTQASFYGSHRLGGNFYIGGQASFAHSRIDANYRAAGQAASLNVKTGANSFTSEIEVGRNFDLDGIMLTPRTSIGYTSYEVSGFRDNAQSLALNVDKIARSGLEARAGLKISGQTSLGYTSGWSVQPEMKLDYVRRLSGNDTNFQLRFADADNLSFALPIQLQNASYGEVKGGVKLVNGLFSVGAAVERHIGQQLYRDDRATLNMSMRF